MQKPYGEQELSTATSEGPQQMQVPSKFCGLQDQDGEAEVFLCKHQGAREGKRAHAISLCFKTIVCSE